MRELDIQKWDYHLKAYKPYRDADGWLVAIYVDDLTQAIPCASCGDTVISGDTYTSRVLHTKVGWGYCVCITCHEDEVVEEKRWKDV